MESPSEPGLDLQWEGYENVDWDRVLKGRLMSNFYCLRKGACLECILVIVRR